jgi:NADH:ubiquinone oxidoreductase subunit F (NADH-binding)
LAGLDPAIHEKPLVDPRAKPGEDELRVLPSRCAACENKQGTYMPVMSSSPHRDNGGALVAKAAAGATATLFFSRAEIPC